MRFASAIRLFIRGILEKYVNYLCYFKAHTIFRGNLARNSTGIAQSGRTQRRALCSLPELGKLK